MLKKIPPIVAATLLSVTWANSAAAQPTQTPSDTKQDQAKKAGTLYDRLGGIFAIAAVVDRFSDAIIQNPKLNKNTALVAWNQNESAIRLPGLKFMRTLWVAALAGGPFKYTGLPLPTAHKKLSLTEEEFDEVGAEIVRALDFYKVPEREKQELVSAYMKSKPQVVTASAARAGSLADD